MSSDSLSSSAATPSQLGGASGQQPTWSSGSQQAPPTSATSAHGSQANFSTSGRTFSNVPAYPGRSDRAGSVSSQIHTSSTINVPSIISASSAAVAAVVRPSPSLQKSLSSLDARVVTREITKDLTRDFGNTDGSSQDVWQTLCIKVLPLFNGEGIKGAIEDLNELVR